MKRNVGAYKYDLGGRTKTYMKKGNQVMQENSSGQMEKEKRYKKLRLDLEALEKKKEMKVPRKIGVIVGVLSSAFLCTMAMRLYFRELILLALFLI